MIITVEKRPRRQDSTPGDVRTMKVGKLYLVDLAGSERLKKSASGGYPIANWHALLCLVDAPPTVPSSPPGRSFPVNLLTPSTLGGTFPAEGQRQHEAKAINLCLTTLGMCINARASGNPNAYVPFRDSKLTRLLQESLGGNARTSLIVCVPDAAEHLEETMSSLQFGQRAMSVVTRARVNEVMDPIQFASELEAKVDRAESAR